MLEKRRYAGGIPSSPLLVVVLTSTLCLSLWHLSSGPVPSDPRLAVATPTYLLLQPNNATRQSTPYPMHQLPLSDPTTLIDVADFAFGLNNFPCAEFDSLLLLVLVHSAPGNREKRAAIRDTWGGALGDRDPPAHRVLFLVGEVDSPDDQAALESENRERRDLVQGSFRDAYRNMTYKHVMALKWTAYFCPGARYLLKTDDDTFVNLPTLVDFLSQELSPLGARRLILCDPFPSSFVKRSYRSKWRVSPSEYPGRVYPTYCAGWAVLYSPDVVFLLYREAQRSEYFWVDDVHITGTLAARVNVTQTALGFLVLTNDQVNHILEDDVADNSSSSSAAVAAVGEFLFGAPNMSPPKIYKLWHFVQERRRPLAVHTPPPS